MAKSTPTWVGDRVARKRDFRVVTGSGGYTDDISPRSVATPARA